MKTNEEKQQAKNEWQKARLEESVFTIAKELIDVTQCGEVNSLISEALFEGFYGYLSESCVKVKTFNDKGEGITDEISYQYAALAKAIFRVMDQISTINAICRCTGEHPDTWVNKIVTELKHKVQEKFKAI